MSAARTKQHATEGGPRKRASVYARKSNDDPRRNKDEASESIEMQVENGQAFIEHQGWEFVHAYTDDAVSAVNWDKRAAWGALMRDAKAGSFDVLVARDRSRLVRDMTYGDRQLRALAALGVTIVSYVDGSVIAKPGKVRAVDHVIDSVQSFAAAQQREQAGDGAREGGCKATVAGHHAGGHVYGYKNIPVYNADGYVAHVILKENPEQSWIVCAAFRAYAAGYGCKTIAHALSGHDTPAAARVRAEFFDGKTALSPSGRPLCSGTSIRDWLHNRRYHGEVIYGKYEWVEDADPETGGTIKSRRRQTDMKKLAEGEGPAIIDDALWDAVQKRLKGNAENYARWGGHLMGRLVSGAASIYALSGLLKCGVCGSNYSGNSHKSSTGKKHYKYECGQRGRHGKHGCITRARPDKDDIERAVIQRIREMLTPAQVEIAIRFHELLASRRWTSCAREGSWTSGGGYWPSQVLVRLLPERLTVEARGRGWRLTGRTALGPLITAGVGKLALPGGIEPPF